MYNASSVTTTSFTVTFGLLDHNGVGYCADSLLDNISSLDVSIFTIARGDGIDTETGELEPVLVVQGSTTIPVAELLSAFSTMAVLRNQRGIGFFESAADASYHQTDLGIKAETIGFDIPTADPF